MPLTGERSFGTLIRDVVSSVQELIRAEVRLARTEIKEDVARLRRVGILFGAAAALAVLSLAFLLMGLVYALAQALPYWAAAVLVGLFTLAVAGGCAWGAISELKDITGLRETSRTVKENLTWSRQPGP
jgi:uncharacterized membrane protein YqjE